MMLLSKRIENHFDYLGRSIGYYFTNPHRIYKLASLKPCTLNAVGLLLVAKAVFVSVVFLTVLIAAAILEDGTAESIRPFSLMNTVLPAAFALEAIVIKPLLATAFVHLVVANIAGASVTFLRMFRFMLCLKAVVIVAGAPVCALIATAAGVVIFTGGLTPSAVAIAQLITMGASATGFLIASAIYLGNFAYSRVAAAAVISGGGVFIFIVNSIVSEMRDAYY